MDDLPDHAGSSGPVRNGSGKSQLMSRGGVMDKVLPFIISTVPIGDNVSQI
jgi:hypothetical protein